MIQHENLTFRKRFWSKVEKSDGCWLWTGTLDQGGYGIVWVGDGKRGRVHRVSWEMHRGFIPTGFVVDHLCRVRHCVNPAHLEPVTPAVNTRRGETGLHRTSKPQTAHKRKMGLLRQQRFRNKKRSSGL